MTDPLKIIRDRCTEEGDCWLWAQGLNSRGYPQMRYDGKPSQMVRRVAVVLDGRSIQTGRVITATCTSPLCCNPAHLVQLTRSQRLTQCYRDGSRATVGQYLKRRSQAVKQGMAKIDMEKAREIRTRTGTHVELAREYGLHAKTIQEIRNHVSWRESATNSSVWNLAAQAAASR